MQLDSFDKTRRKGKLDHLHKDSEEDDGDDGGEKEVLDLTVGQQVPQWERDGAPQPTVGNNELVLFG